MKVVPDRIFNKSPKKIAGIIKAARRELNLTQKEAAAMCGVKRPTIGALEEGRIANVSDKKVWKICEGLGIDTNNLMRKPSETESDIKLPFLANWMKGGFFEERGKLTLQ